MATHIEPQPVVLPPATDIREKLAAASGFALLIAGVVLVTAVLPAEYGLDPLGVGERLGLTAIAPDPATAGGTALEPIRPGANTIQPMVFRRDMRTFKLAGGEGLEFKYQMEQGASFVYSWRATGRVEFDFHGEPVGSPRGYAESYQMGQGEMANGSFFAPSKGIHGWYWKNLGTAPITVTLTSTGFYASGVEFSAAGRTDHEIPAE